MGKGKIMIKRIVFWWSYGRHSTEALMEMKSPTTLALILAIMRNDTEYEVIFRKDLNYINRALRERKNHD